MINTLASLLGFGTHDPSFWMPLLLSFILFAIFVAGVVLDGFDIGVGCLSLIAPDDLKPKMLAMLKPWRDANEFWFFLGLGLYAAAFPYAWSETIGRLYLPLSILSIGLVLRSVCFEFRLRSSSKLHGVWQFGFGFGALLTAFSHGYILARIIVAYEASVAYIGFAILIGICAIAAYCLLGSSWLVMRVKGDLRQRSINWALKNLRLSAIALVAVSLVLDFSNSGIFLKWGEGKYWYLVIFLWLALLLCFVFTEMSLQRMIIKSIRISGLPYAFILTIFILSLAGLGYSFFPYLVLDELTIWDAAASVSVLRIVLSAVVIAMPVAIVFNVWVYWRMLGESKPV